MTPRQGSAADNQATPRGGQPYGRTIRVEGGLKAQSTRGSIGESWWSKRFIAVLESFALGSRLGRGRNYARAGQVLSLTVDPGVVSASVQGSRPKPYDVTIELAVYDEAVWNAVETSLAQQAIFSARLLAGDMPREIEDVFAAAEAPLFPTTVGNLAMECSCPDWQVPCKHLAATFYLLAEAFDADPFAILHWRGRDRQTLLAHLAALREGPDSPKVSRRRTATRPQTEPFLGARATIGDVPSPDLEATLERFWVPPVPIGGQPAVLATDVDLLPRQLTAPPAQLGGPELATQLRTLYGALRPPTGEATQL